LVKVAAVLKVALSPCNGGTEVDWTACLRGPDSSRRRRGCGSLRVLPAWGCRPDAAASATGSNAEHTPSFCALWTSPRQL